jgi:DNA-binding response OmpR family regulator
MATHRILLAEDDFDLRLILAEALREHGHQVNEVADGTLLAQTLAAALQGDPPAIDLVVADLHMPGWPALTVLDALRSRPNCPPIILMTGFIDADERGCAQQLGALGVLDKPFSTRALLAMVDRSGERTS